jgi:hypothetical protein
VCQRHGGGGRAGRWQRDIQCSCLPVRTEPGGGIEYLETAERVEADERFMLLRVDCGDTATGCTRPSCIGS